MFMKDTPISYIGSEAGVEPPCTAEGHWYFTWSSSCWMLSPALSCASVAFERLVRGHMATAAMAVYPPLSFKTALRVTSHLLYAVCGSIAVNLLITWVDFFKYFSDSLFCAVLFTSTQLHFWLTNFTFAWLHLAEHQSLLITFHTFTHYSDLPKVTQTSDWSETSHLNLPLTSAMQITFICCRNSGREESGHYGFLLMSKQ